MDDGQCAHDRVGAGTPAFDLVIFDCDGVLVDSETISCATAAQMLTRHGLPCDLPSALPRYLGRGASAVTDDLVRFTGGPLPDGFVPQWRALLFEEFARSLVAIEGARSVVEALRVRYCLASSSDAERIEIALRKADLWDLFHDRIFTATMVARGKPAPDLFLLAASEMGVDPSRCIVIEDSVPGVIAAKSAGMHACGFTAGSHHAVVDQTQQLLDRGADCIVASMDALQQRFVDWTMQPAGRGVI